MSLVHPWEMGGTTGVSLEQGLGLGLVDLQCRFVCGCVAELSGCVCGRGLWTDGGLVRGG